MSVREQFLADARRHKGNDMTQALRDALDAVKKSEAGGQYTIAAHKAYAFLTAHGEDLLARLTSDGDAEWITWDGSGACPLADHDTLVDVRFRSGIEYACERAGSWFWRHSGKEPDIVAYRIAAPAQPSEGEPR